MYVLRSGITALEKPDNLRRLGELDTRNCGHVSANC
jgi:hypothetical protein